MKRLHLLPAMLALALVSFGNAVHAQQESAESDANQATQEPIDAGAPGIPAPPPPKLIVRDLLVLQADRFGEIANDPAILRSTLFNGVPRRGRSMSDEDGPMPLGLITFEGQVDQPIRVQLNLPNAGSFFHAHWPEDAHKGEALIDWFQVLGADESLRVVELPDQHWLAPLRNADDRLWLSTRNGMMRERFFLYDASLPFQSPYGLISNDGQYQVEREDRAPTPAFTMLVHRRDRGWSADTLRGDWQNGPTTIGSKPTSAESLPRLSQALSPLRDELVERGYNSAEIDLAFEMLRSAGLDNSLISLVYVMPESEINKHLWLRFQPEPDRVIRTVLVVVTNVDPDLGSRIETLITDLGSDDWAKRDLAQRALTEMGQAAIAQVQAQRDHADPEIAFRARQILDAYDMRTQGVR